jgi:hypothetical protein
VAREQAGGPHSDEVLAAHQRLRAENQALWEAWDAAEALPEAQQRALTATASAMGLSLAQIVSLLAIVLYSCCVPSHATVGRWVAQAGRQAGEIFAVLDRVCQAWVFLVGLDTLFLHQEPVLVAVGPHSMAWVAGQRGPDRTGATWGALWQQWPAVDRVVCDAGTGLERGVPLVNEARATASERPDRHAGSPGPISLAVFHPQHELQCVVQRKGPPAEKHLEAASQADQRVAHCRTDL